MAVVEVIKIAFHADNDVNSKAEAVNAAMVSENADLYCFVGDGPYSEEGKGWVTQQKKHFDDKKDKMLWSRGNHDTQSSESWQTQDDMEEWFPEAKSTVGERTWCNSRQVGNVYVISMDTEDMDVEFERDQFNWVKAELAKAKQLRDSGQIDWIVVLFHKPFFTLKSSHSPYTAVRFMYKDLFRTAQVDFCVSGHNHNTQLWYPMIPNQSQANGVGEQLFKYASDGKTFDFTQDHGAAFIVTGHSAHEWNAINDSGEGVKNVMHFRDSGDFGYTLISFDGKKANVLSKDTAGKVHFEYNVTREGDGTPPPPPPPPGCLPSECKDPVTKQCRPIAIDEAVDANGFCTKIGPPPPPPPPPPPGPEPTCTCPPGYKFDKATHSCIKDTTLPPCPPNYYWNTELGKCIPVLEPPVNPPPPPGCPSGQCKDPVTKQCRPLQDNEQVDIKTGECIPIGPPPGCPDGQCKDPVTQQCRAIGADEEKDVNGFCKKKNIPPPPPEGEVDENGIAWFLPEVKGKKAHVVKQSRDEADDDRWSENVAGCEDGFEQTMIAKSIGIAGDGHFASKLGGSNHSGSGASKQRWMDLGVRADGSIQLQWEGPHPSNHDFDLPDSKLFIKNIGTKLEGKWVGLKWAQNILKKGGSPADGGVRWRMWVNTDIAEDGKPDNTKWRLALDFIDGVDVKVIQPQDYRMTGTMDVEVRRSGTKEHQVYAGGLLIRPFN